MNARIQKININPGDPVATGESLYAALLPLIVACTEAFSDEKGKAGVLSGFLAAFCGAAAGAMGASNIADLLDMLSRTLRDQANAIDSQTGRAH